MSTLLDPFDPTKTRKLIRVRGSGGGKTSGSGGGSEDPTTLQSNQIVQMVDLLCEGPIWGFATSTFQSLYLNNTPLQNADGSYNFQGCTVAFKYGYPNDAPLAGADSTDQIFPLTQKILHAVPYTFQLGATQVDAVVLTIGVQGLLQTDTSSGAIHGSSVSFHVDIQPSGGAWTTAFSDTISGKTSSNYSRDYRLELSASQAPWSVRVTKDTADSQVTTTVNDLYLNSYTEIGELNLNYPHSAMVATTLSAQQFGTSVPTRTYLVKGMIVQVPSNYDPLTRSYNGAYWDGTFKSAWTDNPAWVMYDIMTNTRYGLGKRINAALIDKYALYTIAQYCDDYVYDGYGGIEPRFRFNGVLTQAQDAYTVLQSIASTFRGMIYWSAGAVTFTQDSPKPISKLFAPANVVNGQFDYQSSALKDRHSVARVVWNDPNNYYQQTVEVVENLDAMNRFGWRTIDIEAVGTTSRGQAHRIGKWYLDTEFSESETVTFTCSLQEADLMPGQLIDIADPSVAGGRFGGRVVSNNGQQIAVDAPVQLYGTDTIMVVATNGTDVWQAGVVSGDGLNPTQNLVLAAPFSANIAPGSMFLMSSPTVAPRTFRVVSIAESATNLWEVTALFYDPTKFDRIEAGINLPTPNYSVLPTGPLVSPTNLAVVESLFTQNNSLISAVGISWTQSTDSRVSEYDVYAQPPGGNMTFQGTVQVCAFDINTVQTGVWNFQVYSRGLTGVSNTPATISYTVMGKNAPPSDVASLGYTFDPTLGVILNWPGVGDVDLALYEVRQGNQYSGTNWDTATFLGQVKGSSYTLGPGYNSGLFLVKAISTAGNYSNNAATCTVTAPVAAAPTVGGSFVGQNAVLTWNAPNSTFAIDHYEIRTDTAFGTASAALLGTVKGTTFSLKAQWSGPKTFYIAAYDSAGDYGNAGSLTMSIALPSQPTISQQTIDNNVLLKWNAVTATLPIDHYEVRKGSSWAAGTLVGTISGTFDTLFETVAGTYNYWVCGVDSAGNYGTPGSVTATVSQPPDYVLLYNYNSTFNGTITNGAIDTDGSLVMPIDTTTTFQAHFTGKSWAGPSAQVSASYPLYIEPGLNTASYVETFDYGAQLPATKLTVTPTYQVLGGSPTISVDVKVSADNSTWTDYPALTSSVYVTAFRYAKVTLTITGTGSGQDVLRLTGLNVRFDMKQKNDGGTLYVNASDSGGTNVNFNQSFIDVQSITVAAAGTVALFPIYAFNDVANPTNFQIYLFDVNGNRVSGTVSWTARGV
jgi:predicted phage tail protein